MVAKIILNLITKRPTARWSLFVSTYALEANGIRDSK
jgi:hypothetical protein